LVSLLFQKSYSHDRQSTTQLTDVDTEILTCVLLEVKIKISL